MQSVWKTSIRFTLVTAVILGLGYPLFVTGLATLFFPHQAAGSLILKDGKVIGSELLAQSFTSNKYFHPRPSAAGNGYDAQNSSGSNLGPSNKALVDRIQGDIDKLAKENPTKPVPIDMVTTSGSGLDPDITPDAVDFQLQRVVNARGFDAAQTAQLKKLIEAQTTGRQFKILGEPRVNVLELNLELDKIK